MRLSGKTHEDDTIQLTPLIDVVFLLLVFFLTATTFSKDEVEMNLKLPEAGSGVGQSDKPLVISVDAQGTMLFDGRKVTQAGLLQKLRAAAARNRDKKVLIRGDIDARYGNVAKVLDVCRIARLRSISMAAAPQGSSSQGSSSTANDR